MSEPPVTAPHRAFTGAAAASYAEGPARQVPGFAGLQRMAGLLLAESVPPAGRVLVLGAGGGLELQSFASAYPGWRFDGVDPSADMLEVARQVTADHADRIRLDQGYIADAPPGPYDGATALLVLHFVPREQRADTLRQLRARLRDDAPLVIAHLSFSQSEPERSRQIARHVAFGAGEGVTAAQRAASERAISERLTILSPEEEEEMLRDAGFREPTLFYTGFAIRGWVALAGG